MTTLQFISLLIAPGGALVIALGALYLTRHWGEHPHPGEQRP